VRVQTKLCSRYYVLIFTIIARKMCRYYKYVCLNFKYATKSCINGNIILFKYRVAREQYYYNDHTQYMAYEHFSIMTIVIVINAYYNKILCKL